MRNSERGASQVPLVICIVLLVVAAAWGYSQYSELEGVQNSLTKIKTAAKGAEQAQLPSDDAVIDLVNLGKKGPPAKSRLAALSQYTGFADSANPDLEIDPEAIKATRDQLLEALFAGEFVIEMDEERYSADQAGGIKVSSSGGKVKIAYVNKDLRTSNPTVQEVFSSHIVPAFRRAVADVKRYSSLYAQAKAKNEADAAQARRDLEAKDKQIAEKDGMIRSVEADRDQKTSDLRKEVNDANKGKADAEETKNRLEADLTAKLNEARATASQKASEVQVLKERKRAVETDTSPDGTVTAVNAGQDFVVVNIGKKDNLIAGTVFEVYSIGKGGRENRKGMIKAQQVGDATTQCAVIELLDAYNPMAQNDSIRSLTYSPKQTVHFACVGRFQRMGRSDAEARLKALGAAVDPKVTIDTDYLVIGAPESEAQPIDETEAYKTAKMYGVTVITERDLAAFTRY